ncbi:glycoside hydrolase [Pseudovirgaria hyperparasitica]|uniref:Probable beta-glucosidase btgE n=1 Tax=Pseudovirgaria hyperparasitica TaxID=470096 RepID=A0A6A6VY84_9PEZI|nr:glycoside hydrolase [Pseudovirgaria hyperparasitica]KAF2754247.1 glycoside hydrolase [Pseudovirgaria hyperparasitica]
MKGLLIAAGLSASALAHAGHERHMEFHHRRNDEPEQCGCTTYVSTILHEYTTTTWMSAATPAPSPSSSPAENGGHDSNNGGHDSNNGGYSGGFAPITNGDKWAVTYTPYQPKPEGGCKTLDEVRNDVGTIASMGFSTLRTYSTDCRGLEFIGQAAEEHNVKMIIGIFINGGGIDASRQQLKDIVSWGKMSLVEMVVVGNEAIFNGFVTDYAALASYITEVRSTLAGIGYTGPVTTTETLNIWQKKDVAAALCSAVDVVGANIQPFFNPEHTAAEAGDFVASQIEAASSICPGKQGYNLECGWPSQGTGSNGAAVPGESEQRDAISSILAKAGGKSVIFSFENDVWKHPGPMGVEQHFGVSAKNLFG